jgi:hypothetical protein
MRGTAGRRCVRAELNPVLFLSNYTRPALKNPPSGIPPESFFSQRIRRAPLVRIADINSANNDTSSSSLLSEFLTSCLISPTL